MVRFTNQTTIQHQFSKLDKDLRKVAFKALKDAFKDFGIRWAEAMKRRLKASPGRHDKMIQRKNYNAAPSSRSGRLRNSFRARTTGSKIETLQTDLFSTGGVVAFVQEFGTKKYDSSSPIATIRPRTSKYLTIPLPGALTPGGRLKKGARGARDFKGTFFVKGKKSPLVLMQAKGKGAIPIFALRRKIDLRPRLGMRYTFDRLARGWLMQDLNRNLDRALAGMN